MQILFSPAIGRRGCHINSLGREPVERYRSGVYPEIRDAIEIFRQYGPGQAFIYPVKLSECRVPAIEIDDTRTLGRLQSIDLYPESKRAAGVRKLLMSLADAPGRS